MEPASLEANPKLAAFVATVPEGPDAMVVSGGVVSAGGGVPPDLRTSIAATVGWSTLAAKAMFSVPSLTATS